MWIDKVNLVWNRANRYEIDRGNRDYVVVRAAKGSTIGPIGERLDLADALDKLFAWLSAYERAGAPSTSMEKVTRRRQRAEKELLTWFDQFGQLGAPLCVPPSFEPKHREGKDWWSSPVYSREVVDDMAYFVLNLRTLVQRIVGQPMGGFGEQAVSTISEGAARVRRNPETLQWEAPTFWCLLCEAVLNYEDLKWDFRICAASDCTNPFVVTRSNRTMCSKRCSKRMWAQRQVGTRLA